MASHSMKFLLFLTLTQVINIFVVFVAADMSAKTSVTEV